jgi:hypothetical protein
METTKEKPEETPASAEVVIDVAEDAQQMVEQAPPEPSDAKTYELGSVEPNKMAIPAKADDSRMFGEQSTLQNCYEKITVRNSPIEGFGVFALVDIPRDTVLEEIPFVMWPRSCQLGDKVYAIMDQDGFISQDEKHYEHMRAVFGFKHPTKYYFKWYPPNAPTNSDGKPLDFQVLPLGFGPIYNSSNSENNAGWKVKEKTFVFHTMRDIKAGEEIQTFYGYFVTEDGSTFNVSDTFGLGLDFQSDHEGVLRVFCRSMRFSGDKERELRLKESGVQELLKLFDLSNRQLRLRKISVIDGAEEKHPFEFPDGFSLKFHYMKLKEFKQTRFKMIKLVFSFYGKEDSKHEKELAKEVILQNYNG